jgi:ABC-type Zn2+ transport system substrate-binding protein/surface adhesin
MSDTHANDAPGHEGAVAHHAPDDHGDDHGHDDHAHEEQALGPINWSVWIAGAAGVLLGLAVTVALVLATAPPTPG